MSNVPHKLLNHSWVAGKVDKKSDQSFYDSISISIDNISDVEQKVILFSKENENNYLVVRYNDPYISYLELVNMIKGKSFNVGCVYVQYKSTIDEAVKRYDSFIARRLDSELEIKLQEERMNLYSSDAYKTMSGITYTHTIYNPFDMLDDKTEWEFLVKPYSTLRIRIFPPIDPDCIRRRNPPQIIKTK